MVPFQKRFLVAAFLLPAAWGAENASASASRKFHADDPILREPLPKTVASAKSRSIDPVADFVENSFSRASMRVTALARTTSKIGVNTLDEVPDSAWFTNRHASKRMTLDELVRGPGNTRPPLPDRQWTVVGAKSDGVTPGIQIQDASGQRFLLKFDPPNHPEMASAADVIGSKVFYALGYETPENYIVRFDRSQLTLDPEATFHDGDGHVRPLTARQIDQLLRDQPKDASGRYRALASRFVPGTILGPFRYKGTRSDDPNDLIPHEDRRDLRGLAVLAAWMNHTDAKSINTLDSIVEEDGSRFVRHYLIDFGASLGSDSFAAKDPRLGHEYFIDPKPTLKQIATLGFSVPQWSRVRYPHFASVGNFSSEGFDPERWKPNYPNPAFSRLTPQDAFWAAKLVMAFSDEDIRALVSTGQYSDPRAAAYVAKTLCERRDAIGKAYLTQFVPLDRFAVEDDRLTFTDLAAKYGMDQARTYLVRWALYNNETNRTTSLDGDTNSFALPNGVRTLAPGQFAAAMIHYAQPSADEKNSATTVYIRRDADCWTVVGIERSR